MIWVFSNHLENGACRSAWEQHQSIQRLHSSTKSNNKIAIFFITFIAISIIILIFISFLSSLWNGKILVNFLSLIFLFSVDDELFLLFGSFHLSFYDFAFFPSCFQQWEKCNFCHIWITIMSLAEICLYLVKDNHYNPDVFLFLYWILELECRTKCFRVGL